MLPQKNRIPRKDFPTGPRQGSRVFSPLFSGVVHAQKESGVRVSVVVSKKTAKTAVVRNRLRRQFYTAMTPHLQSFSQGALVVLYPKLEAKKAPFSLLKAEIEKALHGAKLLK
jgi:ribonuclease P protein component